ncbi:nucleotide sugar dehydrogenase [Aeromonas diversa CDC 2478-85]|uniref:Nucleotide sugar dehydrogenase n=1 Tax=Aeromonas diversa CDC 2478-85 TaxID=1268237 RepID=N9VHE5_9GAMM|nr:nucleotide sugar dehydrogenase [Aeromonas diversa CDC 2478-85]
MKITVVGIGYVGLSNAVLLSKNNQVIALDLDSGKVDKINRRESPIIDPEIDIYFKEKVLNIYATADKYNAYENADYVIIATPTDYDPETNFFNTTSVESVVQDIIDISPTSAIVIKSTVPVGFTEKLIAKYCNDKIFFLPSFYVREGHCMIIYILRE